MYSESVVQMPMQGRQLVVGRAYRCFLEVFIQEHIKAKHFKAIRVTQHVLERQTHRIASESGL